MCREMHVAHSMPVLQALYVCMCDNSRELWWQLVVACTQLQRHCQFFSLCVSCSGISTLTGGSFRAAVKKVPDTSFAVCGRSTCIVLSLHAFAG